MTAAKRNAILQAGASAARDGIPRSDNPYPPGGEDWMNWMDGHDHQTVWLQAGRGPYEPFANVDASAS